MTPWLQLLRAVAESAPNPNQVTMLDDFDGTFTPRTCLLMLDVLEAAETVEPCDDESWMVPIGGGNPYYHCRSCGVTNVQLNMGEHSRTHAEWCDAITPLRQSLKRLRAHLEGK